MLMDKQDLPAILARPGSPLTGILVDFPRPSGEISFSKPTSGRLLQQNSHEAPAMGGAHPRCGPRRPPSGHRARDHPGLPRHGGLHREERPARGGSMAVSLSTSSLSTRSRLSTPPRNASINLPRPASTTWRRCGRYGVAGGRPMRRSAELTPSGWIKSRTNCAT